jgi:hypothetical protein
MTEPKVFAVAQSVPGSKWRHKRRGTSYEVVGMAELQMTTDLVDGSELVVYRGDDGKLWAREYGEFTDGRFECIDGEEPAAEAPSDATVALGLGLSARDLCAAEEIVRWWDTGKLEGGTLSSMADEMVRISRADESMNIRQAEQAVIGRIVRAVVARAALEGVRE